MIDEARLKELADDFGEDELADLIEIFVAETWEAIDALAGAVGAPADQARADQFHFIKGCARNLGATGIANQCEALERSDGAFTAADYEKLRADFDAVCQYLSGEGLRLSA